VILSLDKW